MSKRTLIAGLAAAAIAVTAAGCGGDDENNASPGTAMDEPPAAQVDASRGDIVEVAGSTRSLSTLTSAVGAADLASTLQGEGPFTVFAPTNAAFAEIQGTVDTLLEPRNKDQLTSVLTYHVVPGELKAADLRDGQRLTTVNGAKLTVDVSGGAVKVGGARVEKADVATSNGVVHVIDTVLVPEA